MVEGPKRNKRAKPEISGTRAPLGNNVANSDWMNKIVTYSKEQKEPDLLKKRDLRLLPGLVS